MGGRPGRTRPAGAVARRPPADRAGADHPNKGPAMNRPAQPPAKASGHGSSRVGATLAPLRQRWHNLQARERSMLALAAAVVAGGLLWALALQPAWRTWQSYEPRRLALEQQLQHMQAMRQQAQQLQQQLASSATASSTPAALAAAVEASAKRLLAAPGQSADAAPQLTVAGDRATVRLRAVPAAQLLQWLREVRETTRSQPVQVQLSRDAGNGTPRWSGHIVLALPSGAQP
ncbi:general secretion pathway protein GspM [Vandammella animalimorsus]|uniref:General secretion pathway protein GspM n=2 Tax=Vandammella animalimorsus TaxID=2029117 RepID=A0A2A2T3X4_9BURK|nr:general secretion pathway protein GspM [Vandammella animalimorsus]PAX16266.1 general secretion pathway protein GspM [Vandammella animalimorsus]PAX19715.1 general secretion pathway protein GspM [Vandammella animalimorsus]